MIGSSVLSLLPFSSRELRSRRFGLEGSDQAEESLSFDQLYLSFGSREAYLEWLNQALKATASPGERPSVYLHPTEVPLFKKYMRK